MPARSLYHPARIHEVLIVVCDLCRITRADYSHCTRPIPHDPNSADRKPPGMVQLRHFDGVTYFWDIGEHLLLQDCRTQDPDPKLPKAGAHENSDVIPLEDIVLPDTDSKQMYSSFYKKLSPDYFSGDIVVKPIRVWQDGDRTATLFEKRNSVQPQIRRTQPGACLNCGSLKEDKALWKPQNQGLMQLFYRHWWTDWFWYIGSKVVIKEKEYGTRSGDEEATVNFVREHTTIPVPAWIRAWHEGERAITLMDRLPGEDYEFLSDARDEKDIRNPKISPEDEKVIESEIDGYVRQLRALTSSRPGTADGQPLQALPFWQEEVEESHWPLPPTHEEAKEDWYNKSLSGVSQEDLAELDRLRDTFPNSEPYTFTHGDLLPTNVMVHEKHVSGIIDWKFAGFAPVWWERTRYFFRHSEIFPKDPSLRDWRYRYHEIFKPNWHRTLDLSRGWRDLHDPNCDAKFERLKQKPIGPPLPPYPATMKDKAGPRDHMDEDGNWHIREQLKPLVELPEFDVSRCYVQ